MHVELVQTTTSDGLTLEGLFLPHHSPVPPTQAIDGVLFVHGSGGNFYRSAMVSWMARVRDAGFATAAFNTRGHDIVTSGVHGKLDGNAYDILDECRFDLDAAVTWLTKQGYQRIGLLGISLGADKVVYYQAHTQDPRVAGVIAFGPVRLSHSYFLASAAAQEHRHNYERAKELVEAGHPDELMPVDFPNVSSLFSAQVYIDRHGPTERYDPVTLGNKIKCPLLILAGTRENHPRHQDCARDMYNAMRDRSSAELVLVEGATHGFPGRDDEFVDAVLQWAGRLRLAPIRAGAHI
jgi:dienelactone hydrolase